MPDYPTIGPNEAVAVLLGKTEDDGVIRKRTVTDLNSLLQEFLKRCPDLDAHRRISFNEVVFKNAVLENMTVPVELSFSRSYFPRDLEIRDCTLSGLSLSGHYVQGNLGLINVVSERPISVQSCQIDAIYIYGNEVQSLNISSVTIADNLTVAESQIDQLNIGSYNDVARRIFISGVKGTNLRIEESTAGHAINLGKAVFKSISFNNCDMNCEIETSDSTCEKLILEKCRFGGQVDLRQLTFDEINLDGSRIQSTLLLDLRQILSAQTGKFPKLKSKFDIPSKIEVIFEGDYDKAINTLFLLRENFRRVPTLSELEDYCAYRLLDLHRKKSNVIFGWAYKRLFGYMLLPSRVLFTAAGIIAGFAVLYSLLPSEGLILAGSSIEWPRDFLTSIYFSVVTFTTLGYGDIHPVGVLRILSIIESLLGPFLVAMFTVALGRKILRW